jgi:thiamine pyrophosphate-dependent acetolactate synthase large subunit-like protein
MSKTADSSRTRRVPSAGVQSGEARRQQKNLARILEAEGVTRIFGIIDGTYFGFYSALHLRAAPRELPAALRRAIDSGGPGVVHVDVDPVKHMWAPALVHFKDTHQEPKGGLQPG